MTETAGVSKEMSTVTIESPIDGKVSSVRSLNFQMLFYGVACVLFWSILLIQVPYIKHYFGGETVFFYIPLVYGLFSNVSRIIVLVYHARISCTTEKKLAQLIYTGAPMTAIGMCCIPLIMAVNGTGDQEVGFWLCMTAVAIVGTFNSLLVTGGFGLMSIAPKGSGQFFLLGFTATGIIAWPVLMLMRWIVRQSFTGEGVNLTVSTVTLTVSSVLCMCSIPVYRFLTSKHPLMEPQLEQQSLDPNGSGLLKTFRAVWIPALSMWFSRFVTFICYPGMVGLFTPSSTAFSTGDYQSFLLYVGPLSDTIGQLFYRYTRVKEMIGMRGLVIFTVVRAAIIIPLFLLSASMDADDVFVSQDWFRCLLMFGFSFSMGINYSAGNALAPQCVSSTDEKFLVGVILSFVAMNGLFVGSLAGRGIKALL